MMFVGSVNYTHVCYDPDGPVGPDAYAEMAADSILNSLDRHASWLLRRRQETLSKLSADIIACASLLYSVNDADSVFTIT